MIDYPIPFTFNNLIGMDLSQLLHAKSEFKEYNEAI